MDILESASSEVFVDFSPTFISAMNSTLMRDITHEELSSVVTSMAKGKALGHDEIPVNFFQQLWPTFGNDFYWMICKAIDQGAFHEGVTRGLIHFS